MSFNNQYLLKTFSTQDFYTIKTERRFNGKISDFLLVPEDYSTEKPLIIFILRFLFHNFYILISEYQQKSA